MAQLNNKSKKNDGNPDGDFQQANMTIYIPGLRISDWQDKLKDIYSSSITEIVPDNDGMTRVGFFDDTDMYISLIQDPEEISQQTKGMANFFSQAPVKDPELKKMLLLQITLFKTIMGFSFMVNDEKNRTDAIISGIVRLAGELNGFILFPDMTVYHPSGKLLISINGESDYDKYYPQADEELFLDSYEESEADLIRRNKNNAVLKEQGIIFPENMKVSVFDEHCVIHSKEEIVQRLVACFAACVNSEIYASDEFKDKKADSERAMNELEKRYGVSRFLSVSEKKYIEDTPDDMNSHVQFGWRYEDCSVLMWSLSLLELKKPSEYCDAAELGSIIWNNDLESLTEKAVLRTRDEILDMQDLVHRYHWACVEARVKGENIPQLDGEIVYEWHYALNWITGAQGSSDWDNVNVTA